MFGDFSRFENDPEVGLNGIYLSQGSPILDSDWNEQVAALTDWITVVGQLATVDKLKRFGFTVSPSPVGMEPSTQDISPGIALLGGRIAQSQSKTVVKLNDGTRTGDRVHCEPSGSGNIPYLSLVSRYLPVNQVYKNRAAVSNGVVEITDWAIYYPNDQMGMPNYRTIGDGNFLVPRMTLKTGGTEPRLPIDCTTCVVEFHDRDNETPQFKYAVSPHNVVALDLPYTSLPDSSDKILKIGSRVVVSPGTCTALDMTNDDMVFVEFEDDREAHLKSARALHPASQSVIRVDSIAQPVPAKLEKRDGVITLTLNETPKSCDGKDLLPLGKRPCLRIWNVWPDSKETCLSGHNLFDVTDEVMATYLITGDRWYLPVRDGKLLGKCERTDKKSKGCYPGHRVFRAIANLNEGNSNNAVASAKNEASEEVHSPTEVSKARNLAPAYPVAHRLDDSLHRLTGALNAARSLTRQTPCKELTTRVSYLPLRRWLASAYVHEIADLDLDRFLAKVQRSIDVAPEDEHRFREQAALILEEANQLAGSVAPRPGSELNRESDTMVSTPSNNTPPMTLGNATRDTLQQAFNQEIPRA